MEKIRVLVLGLGNFGHSWAASVLPACDDCAQLVGVVDARKETWQRIDEKVPKYQNLFEAIDETAPDLVINVTPPDVHCEISTALLEKNIAVLCEKPIADTEQNALKMGQAVQKTGGFLMIGENYRYHPIFRAAKQLLQSGDLGKMHYIQCNFRHFHPDYSQFYHGTLAHPLIEDVTIHHLDLARYLSAEEPVKVWCKESSAEYCWYGRRPASAVIITEMTNGVGFSYTGTLASPVSSTNWNGVWEIECDHGVLKIENDEISVLKDDGSTQIIHADGSGDSRIDMLKEACRALRENRKAETDFADNIKTFAWMRSAIRASAQQDWIEI